MIGNALAWAAAGALVASTLDVLPPFAAGAGRAGLQWAAPLAALVVALSARHVAGRTDLLRRIRPLALPVAALAGAAALSALAAAAPTNALLWSGRIALLGALLLGLIAAQPLAPDLRRLVPRAAAGLVAAWAGIWLVAQLSPGVRSWAYELGDHQHIGGLGRFSGPSMSPTSSGELMLACVAMMQALPATTVRRALSAVGLALAALSLSVATLAAPLALIVAFVPWRRIRIALAVGWAVASLLVMYVHPVQLVVAGHEVYRGELHPSWSASGLGPVHTPLKTVRIGHSSFTGHRSHYWQCVRGNLQCLAAHPVTGVGGMNFRVTCPVTTMDSYGAWLEGRRPHNQYLALGSEHGLLGLLAGLWLVVAFLRRTRLASGSPLETGLLWAYLLCGMQGDVWLQFCAAVWLGVSLELREDSP